MNKLDILNKLNSLSLDKNNYIVISDASMVVQNIKEETEIIELSIKEDYFLTVKDKIFSNITNIKINFLVYDENDIIIIDKIKFLNINKIYEEKKSLNSINDKKDIHRLEMYLASIDNHFLEDRLYANNIKYICGVDEVGRGPLVGPVVAAAVILPADFVLKGLTDSKKLTEKHRNSFCEIIKKEAISYGIGIIDNNIIDEINIYEATKLAMKQAIKNLKITPDYILIDAMKLDIDIPQDSLIKGDFKSISIAAASVLAKVTRDAMMYDLDKEYPYYDYKDNKGYPTKKHIEAINTYGINDLYRKTYGPVSDYLSKSKNK